MRSALAILFGIISSCLTAQDYDFLKFATNLNPTIFPAQVGLNEKNIITAGYLKNFTTLQEFTLAYQKAIKNEKWVHGFGGNTYYSKFGFENLDAQITYSIGYQFSKNHSLHIGTGLINSFLWGELYYYGTDPYYGFVKSSETLDYHKNIVTLSNGIWYNNGNYFVQLGINNWLVLSNKTNFEVYGHKQGVYVNNGNTISCVLSTGFNFEFKYWSLSPQIGFSQAYKYGDYSIFARLDAVIGKRFLLSFQTENEGYYSISKVGIKFTDYLNLCITGDFHLSTNDKYIDGIINYQIALQTRF